MLMGKKKEKEREVDITLEQRRGAEEEFLAQGIYSFLAWDAQIVWMTSLCFQNILVASKEMPFFLTGMILMPFPNT